MNYCGTAKSAAEFVAKGFAEREFFAHRAIVIRKQYPDTFLLLERRGLTAAEIRAGECFQINLYAEAVDDFPAPLFTDRSLNWHSQQLGQKGLIAAAGLFRQEDSLFITLMQSDLCQQLFRHPQFKACKSRVENRFGHWYSILLNAILDFANQCGIAAVYSPTSACILAHIRQRISASLFERIYDAPAHRYESRRIVQRKGEYWQIRLFENSHRIVPLSPDQPQHRNEESPIICIFHDTEEDVDTSAPVIECRENLRTMLEIEKAHGVRTTYTVLGRLFQAKREQIWASDPRHSLGFHSFDHSFADDSQLARCREVDLQVRGYRVPRSCLTPELTDHRMAFLNFEWLASSSYSFGASQCSVHHGMAKIPILTDDYGIFSGQTDYARWEKTLLECARTKDFLAFGLHDCYGAVWLAHYPRLLEELGRIGRFVTADDLCDELFWEQGLDLRAPAETAAAE